MHQFRLTVTQMKSEVTLTPIPFCMSLSQTFPLFLITKSPVISLSSSSILINFQFNFWYFFYFYWPLTSLWFIFPMFLLCFSLHYKKVLHCATCKTVNTSSKRNLKGNKKFSTHFRIQNNPKQSFLRMLCITSQVFRSQSKTLNVWLSSSQIYIKLGSCIILGCTLQQFLYRQQYWQRKRNDSQFHSCYVR